MLSIVDQIVDHKNALSHYDLMRFLLQSRRDVTDLLADLFWKTIHLPVFIDQLDEILGCFT